jgi:hypothetical protein
MHAFDQCLNNGFRFRLPLRGSPRFSLGSLLSACGAPATEAAYDVARIMSTQYIVGIVENEALYTNRPLKAILDEPSLTD